MTVEVFYKIFLPSDPAADQLMYYNFCPWRISIFSFKQDKIKDKTNGTC